MADLQQAINDHQAGKIEAARAQYTAILAIDPTNADALNAQGILLLQTGCPAAAEKNFQANVDRYPADARYQSNLGNACLAQQKHEDALGHFRKASKTDPNNQEYLYNVATCLMATGMRAEAEAMFMKVLHLAPDHYQSLHNLGNLLAMQNRRKDALPWLQKAAAHSDAKVDSVVILASVLERQNQLEEATKALKDCDPASHPLVNILQARLLRRQGQTREAFDLITAAPKPPANMENEISGDWYHEFSLCADRVGKSALAFRSFLNAKSCWRQADQGAEGSAWLQKIRQLRSTTSPGFPETPDSEGENSPVLFVGFPRSGTTLLEAMLDAHPDVVTTGEADLLEPALIDARQNPEKSATGWYLEHLDRHSGAPVDRGKTVVDKLPLNIVFCREIAAAMPKARLVVALRDPRDVVLSCLMQRFRRNAAMQNLDALDSTVSLYEEVMGLWLETRNNLATPYLEYRYEDLVNDRKAVLEGLLDFTRLSWHEDLENYREVAAAREINTPSYASVTEPVFHRAIGRWRSYKPQLEPVLDRLAPFVEAFGYES